MVRIYENFRLCKTLTPSQKCVRLQVYWKGRVEQRFHKHVAVNRLAEKRIAEMLTTLVLRYEEAAGDRIVDAYLTRRGRAAKAAHPYWIHVTYPEPGVIRRYCGGNTLAWVDWVCRPEVFRRDSDRAESDESAL